MLFLESSLGPLLPEHWSELIVGIVLAVLVMYAITKFVVPKFNAMYEERTSQIEGGINRAQKMQLAAEQTKQELETQLANSHDESAKIRQKARQQADQIIADAKAQAQRQADQLLSVAREQIEAERAAAFTQLKSDIGILALNLSERILGESLENSERASRTIENFIAQLSDQPSLKVPDYPPEGS